jgi:arylsulfatase A-like enzyme
LKRITVLALALLLAFSFSLTGCKWLKVKAPTPVYLVAIDTLRADALGVYGGKRPTPFFDEFAKQAIVFENCIAPSSWTVPSMASLMTGQYPFHHGTVKSLQERGRVLSQQTLNGGLKTAAEYFREAEYKTYGISANGHLSEEYGFAQGFDEFVTHEFRNKDAVQSTWNGMGPRIAGEFRMGAPFFAFLFFFDPHHPYTPQEPYINQYWPDYFELSQEILSKDMLELWTSGFFKEKPEAVELARAMYDSEVAALDAHLREMFAELPGYDEAVIIITSDHGEEFMEHGNMIHGNNLQQTQVHVPLMIKLPKGEHAGLRIAEPVSLVDVLPTMMHLIGGNQGKMDGKSLVPLWVGAKLDPRDLFSHLDVPWAQHTAMVRWPFKYIQLANGKRHIFNLQEDPSEDSDLGEAQGSAAVPMFRELLERTKYDVKFPPRVVSKEIPDDLKEKLKNLGYL